MFLLAGVGRVSCEAFLLTIMLDITGNNVDLKKDADRSAMGVGLLTSALFCFSSWWT
jgi:hypothetical protein